MLQALVVTDTIESKSITEVFNGENFRQWKEATQSETDSLMKNETWDLVNFLKGKNVICCKWVFKLKHDASGNISRYKARLVTQGYSQKAGVHYDEVYAPVARYNSIRSILAIANELNLDIHQSDGKTVFLNGELENEIYMEQPEGFEDKDHSDMVL